MTNWFQTYKVQKVFGWGPSKRMIVLGGVETPSGSSCLEGVDNDELIFRLRALLEQARKAGCVYVEIRCFEDYSAWRGQLEEAGFEYEEHYDVLFDMSKDPLMQMKPNKRQQLKRAQEKGETWRETRGEGDIHEWYRLLRKLYRTKVHRPLPKEAWFREMILEKGCRLLVTEKIPSSSPCAGGEKIIGGAMLAVEDDRRKAYEWYKCGQVMATWAALEWCRQNGVAVFDAMGAGRPGVPYSVRDFKLEMGGQLVEYGRYRCVLKPMWYRLGEWVMGFI